MLWFTLFHWPCSTTLLTIRKETGSLRWTALAVLLPTLIGILGCMLISLLGRLDGVAILIFNGRRRFFQRKGALLERSFL